MCVWGGGGGGDYMNLAGFCRVGEPVWPSGKALGW